MVPDILPVASDQLAFLLSRIQFGLSVGYHFLFPATTLGLTFLILLSESLHLKSKDVTYRRITEFSVKLLTIVFALGVATGIIMPFAFGTNWARFVEFAGSVFGIHLTLEAVIAFMLEAFFLGVLLFGRNKVGPKVYWLAAFLVFLGSHLSGFFILSANSWMQAPFHSLATLASGIPIPAVDGFHLEQTIAGGTAALVSSSTQLVPGSSIRVVMDDVLKILFNPTTGIRVLHTTTASWATASVVFLVVAAWLFRKGQKTDIAKKIFKMAVILGAITSLLLPVFGHEHIMQVAKWQPVKSSAMEGIFKTQTEAPLYVIGVMDEEKRQTYGIGVPYMLSVLEGWNINAVVQGVDDLTAQGKAGLATNQDAHLRYEPPMQPLFQAFHLMVMAGVTMIGGFLAALWILWKKKWDLPRWVWTAFMFMLPLPYLAVELGWMVAEVGRQPWIVYGLMKTESGLSPIPREYVIFSLSLFVLVYIILSLIAAKWIPRIAREALIEAHEEGDHK